MHGLTQWGALELLASDGGDGFAALLDVPATWWVDPSGVAHGRPEHAVDAHGNTPESITGTLADLAAMPRHTKSCASLARVAGDAGVQAATVAQRLTEGLHGIENLQTLEQENPALVYRHATTMLERLPEVSDPALAGIVETARQKARRLAAHALERSRSDEARQQLIDTAIEYAVWAHPQSPVAAVRQLIKDEPSLWVVENLMSNTPVDQAWVTAVTQAVAASKPRSLASMNGLDATAIGQIVDGVSDGATLRARLEDAWRTRIIDLVCQVPDWHASYRAYQTAHPERLAVIVAAPTSWQTTNLATWLAWGTAADGIAIAPLVVAEALANGTRYAYSELDEPLGDHELETLATLASDAAWASSDIAGLVATARALA